MKITILDVAFHRNGCTGAPFHTIVFSTSDSPRLVATLFEEKGLCAVHSLSELAKGNIGADNTWRGDLFEKHLRRTLAQDYPPIGGFP